MTIQKRKGNFILTLVVGFILMISIGSSVQAAVSLQDATYNIGVKVFKSGETTESRSAGSVKSPAKIVVSGGKIQAQVAFKNTSLTEVKVGGSSAKVISTSGEWTTYQFSISNENATVPVSVMVPAMGATQTIDLSFQGNTADLVQGTEKKDTTTNKSATSDTKKNTNKTESPKTADDFNILITVLSAMFGMIALYGVVKKVKQ
ncbi:hypothetical protein GC105_03950 [Alkalibaculum sp. M08DMB]|uniref:NEAT domain-containing protein n=1 Tax=Alkalibaculum sporogenes TaxID=2655001 RepID=A0A6A7K691_9FIRM|nr:NEAT domain-containing protein [Alkalibaculum sporogenes]MPW24940.1 hypothetical protein [Alkalibaculum sporogenes]